MADHTYQKWTNEEILFLSYNIDEPVEWLSRQLGRSFESVKRRRTYLAKKYRDCGQDCYNCPYPDCFRPAEDFGGGDIDE